jgi:hypothetical protein
MNLERNGFGYSGLDTKPKEQTDVILSPLLKRGDFEWRGRNAESEFFHLWELNEWYNSKLAVMGMFFPLSMKMGLVTGRVFETLGSGTPLICYYNPAIIDILGTYTWQSNSVEETEALIYDILEHPQQTNKHFLEWSKNIHKIHSYHNRVETLLKRLEEMR